MNGSATYTSEDIEVVFTARMVNDDYGVPGSPTWLTPDEDSIEINELFILNEPVSPSDLPRAVVNKIYGLAGDLEWEVD